MFPTWFDGQPGLPNSIPAIVFAAIVGIVLNLLFLTLPPHLFGVRERENINFAMEEEM